MFARRKAGKRFSLLLLEDEEFYVADWVASCGWPPGVAGNWGGAARLPGRLRLATKSLFFEPDDARVPIVRLEFAAVVQLEADGPSDCVVGVNKVTKMKANGADEPYVVERHSGSTWRFSLTYARLDDFMPLAQEQLVISRLPAPERLALLDAAAKAREDAAPFDTSRLVEFSERLVWEGPVLQLTPLMREPGRLAVTDGRVYFQPLHNIAGDTPVRSHPLAAVAAVARRRSSLRPVGLELFMLSPSGLVVVDVAQQQQEQLEQQEHLGGLAGPFWDAPSAFFTFRSQEARDKALAAITAQPQLGCAVASLMPAAAAAPPSSTTGSSDGDGSSSPPSQQQPQQSSAAAAQQLAAVGALLEAHSAWLHRVMAAWQLGRLSNFDYLLYLNLAAGRSFNDLAQWPVFPWVLRDYGSASLDLDQPGAFRDLSKPMGAQTPARLEVFRQRFRDMESLSQHVDAGDTMPQPFMYGTHYSTPGYVMFWLVRAAPAHMLRLQGGKFDSPDRLFNSWADAWASATTSTTDVKELIPEFYMPGGDFLVNGSQLALGVRQNGRPVNDVALPPWATSPEDALAKHRAALEAPYVSAHLHEWIDLVFGAKQSGPAAVEADNVFYHLTYEGAVDITKVTALQELRALETQINEFGQTPKQLFAHPHPPRLVQPPAPDPATVFSHSAAAAAAGAAAAAPISQGRASPGPLASPGRAGGSAPAASGGSSSSKAALRLKGGGEDAAGGAICFALLSTLLAAASPDIDHVAEVERRSAAAAADKGRAGPASEGQLSPVSSGDLDSAAPCSASPAAAAGKAGQQQQPQVGALRGMLNRLTEGATAGVASVASAVQGSSSSSGTGLALPVGLTPGKPGLMLARLQQQFTEGLALRSSSSSASAASGANLRSTSSSTLDAAQLSSQAAAANGEQPVSSSATAAAAGVGAATQGSSSSTTTRRCWPRSLPDSLLVKKSVQLQPDPVTAVAAADAAADGSDGGHVFVVGHSGLLRVLDGVQLSTVRSMKLEHTELLCISLLPPGAAGSRAAAGVPSGGSGRLSPEVLAAQHTTAPLPFMLAGAQSGRVLGYAATAGRLVGSWAAHADAVSCMLQLGGGGPGSSSSSARLATASWDCSVKLWELSEGRQPWTTTTPIAAAELRDLDAGVWALAGSGCGRLLVSGSEEGVVAAWDLRTRRQIWAAQASKDYVGGLALLPGGNYVAAAAADGTLSLLDWRRAGEPAATAGCGAPLRCCACDGALVLAGSEAGQLHTWNLAQLTGGQLQDAGGDCGGGGFSLAGPDGLYPPLSCPTRAAVNGVAVAVDGGGGGASVLAALEDGSLVRFSTHG